MTIKITSFHKSMAVFIIATLITLDALAVITIAHWLPKPIVDEVRAANDSLKKERYIKSQSILTQSEIIRLQIDLIHRLRMWGNGCRALYELCASNHELCLQTRYECCGRLP